MSRFVQRGGARTTSGVSQKMLGVVPVFIALLARQLVPPEWIELSTSPLPTASARHKIHNKFNVTITLCDTQSCQNRTKRTYDVALLGYFSGASAATRHHSDFCLGEHHPLYGCVLDLVLFAAETRVSSSIRASKTS